MTQPQQPPFDPNATVKKATVGTLTVILVLFGLFCVVLPLMCLMFAGCGAFMGEVQR